jgi:hypothetical protein
MRPIGGVTAVLVAALSFGTAEAGAQALAFDLRTTGALSTQKLAGAELDTGLGIGGALAYRLQPHLFAYAGWDWLRFHAAESFVGADADFEETGYTVGFRFEHPLESGSVTYRVEAGATYKHVEVESEAGELLADSGHEAGFELAGGVSLPLSGAWRLTPSLRYRSLQPVFEVDGVSRESALRYGALEVGVSYRF